LAIQQQHWAIYPPNGGFDVLKARRCTAFLKVMIRWLSLGYMGDPQTLPELLQRVLAPRSRKPLEKFVFSSSWNQASPLVRSQD